MQCIGPANLSLIFLSIHTYVLLPNRKAGSNICHVLRLPPPAAVSKAA